MANGRRIGDRDGALSMQDHDLLIQIDTKLGLLTAKVEEHQASNGARVSDHETRIRSIESWVYKGIGGLAFVQIILTVATVAQIVWSFFKH